jgi:hypothetical protein
MCVSSAVAAQNAETALAPSARCAGVTIRAAMQEVADSPAHYAMHRQHDYWRARVAAEAGDLWETQVLLGEAVSAAETEAYRRLDAGLVEVDTKDIESAWRITLRQMAAECAEARAALETH